MKLDRKNLHRMILSEMKMLGMKDLRPVSEMHMHDMEMDQDSAFGAGYSTGQEEREEFDYTGDLSDLSPDEAMGIGHQAGLMGLGGESEGTVSREDCCAAVICLVECCSCPITKAAIIECCSDILAGQYDS
jgi:hypothetical protein